MQKDNSVLVAAIVLVIILIAAVYFYRYTGTYKPPGILLVSTPTPDVPAVPDRTPTGWKVYTDTTFGYTIGYPAGYEVQPNGNNSITVLKKTTQPGAGPANFIYVSVIPKSDENKEGLIYNYNKKYIDLQRAMSVGEHTSMSTGENPDLTEWFTYTRVADEQINTVKAQAYVNDKPWEFPSGTSEYRYIIIRGDTIYLLGGYIGAQSAIGYFIPEEEFRQIIQTFTL